MSYIAYAAGFATGNLFGMYLESRLAIGLLVIRSITTNAADELVAHLVFIVIKHKRLADVRTIITRCSPKVFVSVEESRSANEDIFPVDLPQKTSPIGLLTLMQKRK